MNSILERRELRNLPIFEEFLTLEKLESKYKPKDIENHKPKIPDLFKLEGNNINNFTMKEYKKMCRDNLIQGQDKNGNIDFVNFSDNLSELIEQNVPLYSKIKHASLDLKKAFQEGSQALIKMSSLMNKVLHNKTRFIKSSKLNADQDTDEILKVLKKGLEGWATNLLTMNNYIEENITTYFHFSKHELTSLKELEKVRNQCMSSFKMTKADLGDKKLKLFETRKVEKWGSKEDTFEEPVKEVLSNFKIAAKYILPKETGELRKMKQVVEFVCFQQIGEYLLFRKRFNRRFIENFTKFGDKIKNCVMDNKDVLWNTFDEFKKTSISNAILSKVDNT